MTVSSITLTLAMIFLLLLEKKKNASIGTQLLHEHFSFYKNAVNVIRINYLGYILLHSSKFTQIIRDSIILYTYDSCFTQIVKL